MSQIGLVINPRAGRGRGAQIGFAVRDRLRAAGFQVRTRFSERDREADHIVQDWLAGGLRDVVLAGGDGTIFQGLNGFMRTGLPDATLGVVPIGTGNDFVKMLDLAGPSRDAWREACARIVSGVLRHVDVGRCNQVFFANGMGLGLDAQVAMEANRLGWVKGTAVYGLALARVLARRPRPVMTRLEVDGEPAISGPMTLVSAANGRCYGGNFRIAPTAQLDDGLLELIWADGLSVAGIMRLVPSVMLGRHIGRPHIHHRQCRSLRIRTETPVVVHADGEIVNAAATAVDVQILPGALPLRA